VDAATQPGRAIGRDISKGEAVEHEIDAFISRRDGQRRQTEGECPEEEAWQAGVRAYDAARREEMRTAWREYHQGQAARLRGIVAALIAFHEGEAAKLCGEETP
jgi:hypothetical protein